MRPVTSRCGELAASLENFINAMRECRGQDPLYPTRQEPDEVRFYPRGGTIGVGGWSDGHRWRQFERRS